MEQTATKISINFNEVQLLDLDGAEIAVKDIAKLCANHLYTSMPTIELIDAVRELHGGNAVEFTPSEIGFFINLFKTRIGTILAFVKVGAIAYLEGKLKDGL